MVKGFKMKKHAFLKTLFLSIALLFIPLAYAAEPPVNLDTPKQQVDVNTADAATLALALDGVGTEKAREIVAYREKNGDFKSIDELMEVKGIGEATVERNRDRIIIKEK
jgi:competence protein ComEA